MDGNILTLR